MTRAGFFDVVIDPNGRPIRGVTVTVYATGTLNLYSGTIWAGPTASTTLANPFTANDQGEVQFWLAAPTRVDLAYSKNGYTGETETVDAIDTSAATTAVAAEAAARAAADALLIPLTQKAAASGVATLDGSTTVPDAQIPATIARDAETTAAVAAEATLRTAADALLIPLTQKGAASGVATLDGSSKVPTAQLPTLAINETFVVASQAAMLALTAERGDMAVRTDLSQTFVLTADAPTVLGNWVALATPSGVTAAVAAEATLRATGDTTEATARGAADSAHAASASAHSGTYERVFGVEAYGATASTTPAQNSVAFQAAVDASVAAGSKLVSFARSYQFSATVQINDAGVVFRGPSPDNAVTLTWTGGAGTAIQIGTDNGHAYDAGDYDGPSGFTLENINLTAGVTGLVALDNGLGNYVPSSYGIRDWRGGNVTLRHARLVSWDVPFWGIQSDFDRWDDVIIHKAHSGVYLGPRSDQLVGTAVYFLQCDRALDLDSCWQPRFYGASFVDNGAAATNPIRIRSQFARCATAVNFDDCWFEHLTTGLAAAAVEAFVEIGVGDTNTASGITFTRPKILNNQSGTPPRVQYFAKIGKADLVVIDTPQGDANQFDNILRFVGSSNPGVRTRYDHALTLAAAAKYSNGGSGAPTVLAEDIGLGRFGIGDGTGREAFRFTPGNSPQLNIVDPVGGGDIHRMTWTTQDAGQLFIDLAASTSQLHIRDAIGSGNDMLRIQPSTGLYLGYAGFKVGFYGTTPATQPAGSVDVLAGLVTLGLRAASSNPPLNLGSGALTAGAATLAATTVTTLGTGGLVTLADGNNVAVGTTTGTQIGTGATQKLGFFGATPVVQRPATTDIKQVLVDLGLLVGAGSTGINLNGGNLFTSGTVSGTGGTTAGSNTTAGNANINGPAASARQLLYQTAGSNRWLLRANSTAEGGSNAGSDFEVAARDDSGAALSTALIIRRSDARATFAGEVVTPLSTTTRAGLNVPHGAAPTSPADGDVWTTTAGLFVRINGVTKTVTLT